MELELELRGARKQARCSAQRTLIYMLLKLAKKSRTECLSESTRFDMQWELGCAARSIPSGRMFKECVDLVASK